jgi:hypothetical protein
MFLNYYLIIYVLYSSLIAERSLMTAYRVPCRRWQLNIRLLVRLLRKRWIQIAKVNEN